MESTGATVSVWNALDGARPRPSLDDIGGIVVFGSTFNVGHADEQPFIKETADLIREAVERRIPFLGVCFGGQLLAWALDARVGEGPVREIGFEPIHPTDDAAHDLLFSHLADGDLAFQWHGDAFDLPEGATLLATGDRVPNQAFRVGRARVGHAVPLRGEPVRARVLAPRVHEGRRPPLGVGQELGAGSCGGGAVHGRAREPRT